MLTTHDKLIDEYHSKMNSPYFSIAKNKNIKTEYEEIEEKDWMDEQFYLLMISSVSEVDYVFENVLKRERSKDTRNYANFGKCTPRITLRRLFFISRMFFRQEMVVPQ